MKESVIKVLKVKPHEHPEVYMLKNTLRLSSSVQGRTARRYKFGCISNSTVLISPNFLSASVLKFNFL